MKIIASDNFGRETVSDALVCGNVSEAYGKLISDLLKDHNGDNGPRYYRPVPDDYVLYKWEP